MLITDLICSNLNDAIIRECIPSQKRYVVSNGIERKTNTRTRMSASPTLRHGLVYFGNSCDVCQPSTQSQLRVFDDLFRRYSNVNNVHKLQHVYSQAYICRSRCKQHCSNSSKIPIPLILFWRISITKKPATERSAQLHDASTRFTFAAYLIFFGFWRNLQESIKAFPFKL